MNKLLILSLLALSYQTASAQSLLETFGNGANEFTMEFVPIGNPGNAADTTGNPNPAGSVAYTYNLAKYEVSRDMITKANSAGNLGITLQDMTSYGGNGANKPATGVSWLEAATYVNWLNTSTGNTAAYKFVGGTFQLWSSTDAGYNANNQFRNSNAKFWLPSTDDWYKAAYGNRDGTWNNYPTGSDNAPTAVASGTAASTAAYNQSFPTGPADITSAGGLSPWGTMGQGGNVQEWIETAVDGINNTASENREQRGGSWGLTSAWLGASARNTTGSPTAEFLNTGFRVASVPEPSSLSFLLIGVAGVASRRLLKRRS